MSSSTIRLARRTDSRRDRSAASSEDDRLRVAEVAKIRAAKRLGLPAHHLAAIFNVSRSTIYNVWGGIHYPCLPPPPGSAAAHVKVPAA